MIFKSLRRLYRRLARSRQVAKEMARALAWAKASGRNVAKFKARFEHRQRVALQSDMERLYSFGGQRTLRPWKLAFERNSTKKREALLDIARKRLGLA